MKLTYKIAPATEGRDFVSMFMEIDDFIVGDSEAISVLGLMVGEARKIIDNMLKIKQNAHGSLGVDCIEDLNAFFDYSFEFVLGAMKDPVKHEIFGEIINRTTLAFPFANECFDGEIGFLSYMGGDSGFLMWRDFRTMQINARIISYSSYSDLWQSFVMDTSSFAA